MAASSGPGFTRGRCRQLLLLSCLATVIVVTSTADVDQEDLVFDDLSSDLTTNHHHWSRQIEPSISHPVDSPSVDSSHSSNQLEQSSGFLGSIQSGLRRIKRSLWDPIFPSDESKETFMKSSNYISLSRNTRSVKSDSEELEDLHHLRYLRQVSDDEDMGGESGDSSGVIGFIEPHNTVDNQQNVGFYRTTLNVIEPHREEYEDITSPLFQDFSNSFSSVVNRLYDDVPGTQNSQVIKIERLPDPFALKVTLDIVSDNLDSDTIRKTLYDHIQQYNKIGNYTVSTQNFSFREHSASYPDHTCQPGEIQCSTVTGENCLPPEARCNEVEDCIDGRDEQGCPPREIDSNSVTVAPSLHSNETKRCRADDSVRCADGSVFICADEKCDGKPDCPGGDDELNCPFECPEGEFMCDMTRCIPGYQVCDGSKQCTDNTDERDCPPKQDCAAGEFLCDLNNCISQDKVCNGFDDCSDKSDENNCPPKSECPRDDFQCYDGSCIRGFERCNQVNDCRNGEDELNCACSSNQWQCDDGVCLDLSVKCNQRVDCPRDNSDEQGCPQTNPVICRDTEFKCNDLTCIPFSKRCNGVPDCPDQSDEEDSLCDQKTCSTSELTCGDGSCIPLYLQCDGHSDCRDGLDEQYCTRPSCNSNEITCGNGSCVPKTLECDGHSDCPDGADERNCQRTCSPHEFLCDQGQCIPLNRKCDGFDDCYDYTDEKNCSCRADQFQCRDGRCILSQQRCDGRPDCRDYSDEENCHFECSSLEFRCNSGECIPNHQHCDKHYHCPDGSDETGCESYFELPTTVPPFPRNRVQCEYNQFACHSGDQCVPQYTHCDQKRDCNDASDEFNCATTPDLLLLKTYPPDQIIKESREVVFQCRDEGPLRANVRWIRDGGQPLPPGSRDLRGRLEMPNIKLEHAGKYTCEAVGYETKPGSRVSVELIVEPFEQPTIRPPIACLHNEATCSNGDCIPKSQVCNDHYDCIDGSDELRCNRHGCEPNQFRCDNGRCVQKTWRCDSDDDCGDGSDERNCGTSPPGSQCHYDEFMCTRGGQCIPKAFHCDMEVDCMDRSDELGCSKVTIQTPPPPMIVLQPGDLFTVTCTAVGVPAPEVIWRLNWGHIPDKCNTTSVNGFGTLTCPNIQESDQGAYSCEAMNNRGSVFAIPDTILVVKPNERDRVICPRGQFNEIAIRPEECIKCFCFGVTTECRSANLFIYQFPPPLGSHRIVNVYVSPSGSVEIRPEDSQYQPNVRLLGHGFQISTTNNDLNSYDQPIYPYFALPENYYGNQLTSYGGYIKYTVNFEGSGSPLDIPDIILTGNGYTLVYKGYPLSEGSDNNVAVQIFPQNWYKVASSGRAGGDIPSRGTEPATREDLMMALQKVDNILVRTQYLTNGLETTLTDIIMDSAGYQNTGQGKAAFVEECSCPPGYTGLSCEKCSAGYHHQATGPWLGHCYSQRLNDTCPPLTYGDPRRGIPCEPCPCPLTTTSNQFARTCSLGPNGNVRCDCLPGYQGERCESCAPGYKGNPHVLGDSCRKVQSICDPAGSVSAELDEYGRCVCKSYATGLTCNQCKPNTFNLAVINEFGCVNCFCMGINTTCDSSNLYRTQISAAFTRTTQDFKLVLSNRLNQPISDNIQVNPAAREIIYQDFLPEVYYWVLPSRFLYNKVSSYGGNLRYTLRYVPTPGGQSSRNNAPDVEIVSVNGVHLSYFHNEQLEPNRPVTVSVPLLEQYWQRADGQRANREHLLMTLAELENIYIKATYTTNTQEAGLISVSLDIAEDRNTGQSRAVEVEQCACPPGYRGTSCEECETGYTRIEEGLYLGICELCNCNGHSNQCDPEVGTCMNCRDNTEGDQCNVCQSGFVGNPLNGGKCTRRGETCNCDPRGSVSTECRNNQCTCKTNVGGLECGHCIDGTFDLSELHIEGCLECFCSGVAHTCQSSNLYRDQIPMQIIDRSHTFKLTDINRQQVIQDDFLLNIAKNEIGFDFNNQRGQRLFWSLPADFTGNKITSYGGNLTFTQHYTSLPNVSPSYDTDVVIVGPGITLYWTSEEVLHPNETRTTVIPLFERYWRRNEVQRTASRADMLNALSNIDAILIRASHSTHTILSYLSDVTMDTTVSWRNGQSIATSVEVCSCPPGYKGTSCESCTPGFYKDYDRSCKRCPCNNNEEYCALGPNSQVVCYCKPTYAGPTCANIGGIMMKLTPDRVNAVVGSLVKFTCSYISSEPLIIEFDETFTGIQPTSPALYNRAMMMSLMRHNEGAEKFWNVEIKLQHKMVSCRVRNRDGVVLGTLSTMIHPYTTEGLEEPYPTRPSSPPTISISLSEPTIRIVEAGSFVRYTCTGRSLISRGPITLKWSKEGGPLPDRAIDDSHGMLIITNVRVSDSGTYICSASDGYSLVTERTQLTVGGGQSTPPRVTIEPPYLQVREGQPVEFRCSSSGVPTPNLRWEKDGQDTRLNTQSSFSNGVFRIPYVSKLDEGQYKCVAENPHGSSYESVTLHVYESTSEPATSAPEPKVVLTVEPREYSGHPGDTVHLRCLSSSSRNVRYRWTRLQQVPLPASSSTGEDGVLTIYNASPNDSGIYVCIAISVTTGQQESEVQARINIIGESPRPVSTHIEPDRQTVSQGSIAELRCVHGSQGTVQWSKAGETELPSNILVNGPILRISNTQVEDRGVYICQVQSPEGSSRTSATIEVERREPPSITMYPRESQTVIEGGSALFHCRLTGGIPQPSLRWSRPDNKPYPTRNIEEQTGGVLRFNSVTKEEEGQYMCTAENPAGSRTVMATLEVHSYPVITIFPPSPVMVSPGQRVRLECRATGYPQPTVSWSKHQTGISFYNLQEITAKTPLTAIYEIASASHADEGSYTCIAQNAAGPVEERIQLIVSPDHTTSAPGRGDIPVDPYSTSPPGIVVDDAFTAPFNGSVEMRCTLQGPILNGIYLNWVRSDGMPLPSRHILHEGTLHIDQLQYSDAGAYVCQGIGRDGSIYFQATTNLRVTASLQIRLDPTRQVVKPGDSAQITCTAIGEEPIEITWMAVGRDLPSSVTIRGGHIHFQNIKESDAGRYMCTARDTLGQIAQSNSDVIVNEHNLVTAVDRHPRAYEGSSIRLRCDTDNNMQIYWTRESQPLPYNSVIQGSSLRLDNLRLEDGGRYICNANTSIGTASDYIDLQVEPTGCGQREFRCGNGQCIPMNSVCDGHSHCQDGSDETVCGTRLGRDLETNLELTIEPSKEVINFGDSVDVRCFAKGAPNTRIYWAKLYSDMAYNERTYGDMLRIDNANTENSATFRCSAQLESGNIIEKDYIVHVEDKPHHDAAAVEVLSANYGDTIPLQCTTDLEPPVTYTWTKQGSVLPSHATPNGVLLNITSISYQDAGFYICTANNSNVRMDIPRLLVVKGAVPFFSQAPSSYLSLPTLPNAYLHFEIEISFKPQRPDGLILYNGQQGGVGDFISFGLRDGIPEFRFDMGSGSALIKGDTPLTVNEWHTVKLTRAKKNGAMYVDGRGPFQGVAPRRHQGLDLNQPLYVGGVPDFGRIHNLNGFETGFVGCISRLKIGKTEHDLIKDAVNKNLVTSCETCAVNPCLNNGACQEAPTAQGFTCICPRGFSGDTCNKIGEPCYPDACGKGRCVNSEEGIECYCPLGKGGSRCSRDVSVTIPAFTSNGYLAYPVQKSQLKSWFTLKFKANDTSDGILLYCAQNGDGQGDFVSLAIKDRRLEFRFDTGSGVVELKNIRDIPTDKWLTVYAERSSREGRLAVTGELAVSTTLPGVSKGLDLRTPLYIGGYDKEKIQIARSVGVNKGFSGCISEVDASGSSLTLSSITDAANIGECTDSEGTIGDPCKHYPCLHNGVCYPSADGKNFDCVCQSGYSGTLCEVEQDMCVALNPCENGGLCIGTPNSYKCNCPMGYSGPNCQHKSELRTQASFQGDGYIELSSDLLPHTGANDEEQVVVEFSTTQPNGLIFWHGQTPDVDGKGQDYMSLAVVNGFLELSYELGSDPAIIQVDAARVDDGKKHKATIKRQGKDGTLELDHDIPFAFGASRGLLTQLNTKGNIYIGGLPNIDLMTGGRYSQSFHGCIHSLQIQQSGVINYAERAISAINVLPCSSTNNEDYDYDSTHGGRGEVIN